MTAQTGTQSGSLQKMLTFVWCLFVVVVVADINVVLVHSF